MGPRAKHASNGMHIGVVCDSQITTGCKMLKITVLLPVNYNDGSPIDPDVRKVCLGSLSSLFDGFTCGAKCYGEYRMDDGSIVCDTCEPIWVVVDSQHKVELVREWAKSCCVAYRQECIYMEVQEVSVEFIKG